MLKELRLQNFRKHEDRTFHFTKGLNVLRGASEDGKSTILEALMYLLLGSRMLGEALEDVVTYDKPLTSLKVTGLIEIDGVEYSVTRSKNGAEIVYGGDKRVTGQSDTRAFMENLLGAPLDQIRNLIFAAQNSVRGLLEGDTDSAKIIEKLAQLDTIEVLADKIKTQLPSGNTKAMEASLANLKANSPLDPVEPSAAALEQAQNVLSQAEARAGDIQPRKAAADEQKLLIDQQLAEARLAQRDLEAYERRRAELLAIEQPAPCTVTEADIDAARRARDDVAFARTRLAAYNLKFPSTLSHWNGNRETLATEIAKYEADVTSLDSDIRELDKSIASTRVTASTEVGGKCPTCGTEIQTSADLLQHIEEAKALLEAQETVRETKFKLLCSGKEDLDTLKEIQKADSKVRDMANLEFYELDESSLPVRAVWRGEPPQPAGEAPDIDKMTKAVRDFARASDRYADAQTALAGLTRPTVPDTTAARAWLADDWEKIVELTAAAARAVDNARASVNSEKRLLEQAQASYLGLIENVERHKSTVEGMEKELNDMTFNNELLKDLRDAREQIRQTLWSSVMSTVSMYFSRLRGTETVISQGPDGFTQNGRSVKGLSGSTKDMLGLAIRAALSKTFLPNSPIFIIDEPFSGCDDDREIAGLGTLAVLDFKQTLLVTHSDLADAVADNCIRL